MKSKGKNRRDPNSRAVLGSTVSLIPSTLPNWSRIYSWKDRQHNVGRNNGCDYVKLETGDYGAGSVFVVCYQ